MNEDVLLSLVRRTIAEEHMLPAGEPVLCGLSGGADSVALTLCLHELGISLCACHLNHGLRAAEADEDEAFCRALCQRLGVPLVSERIDVAAQTQGESIETAARRIRYDFFARSAKKLGASCIATAHTADDNLETMLFRLLRGTGAKGLAGIPPVRDNIIRPLIAAQRSEIEAFLRRRDQPWRTDSTNLDDGCTRNRIRHTVIPALRAIEPSAARHALETARQLRQDEAFLQACAEQRGAAEPLAGLPEALRRRALRHQLEQAGVPLGACTARHMAALDGLLTRGRGQLSLPGGFTANMQGGALILHRREAEPLETVALCWEIPVTVGAWRVRLTRCTTEFNKTFNTFFVDCDTIVGRRLMVRRWQSGDRLQLPGSRGARTLKRLYAERGIQPDERDTLPVIVTEEGAVVAAANIGVALPFAGDTATLVLEERKR